ncbi:MAG: 3-phosphoshikimate 1-carboxyvinyltransferase [Deltaproteobacteria bacterium]|nr:3-phosphoshikimate 1-carboxyvinyltransferase [Deltaproteobacteria bacterium]
MANLDEPVPVRVPGSKSLTHRYIICAALAAGESCLDNALESRDISRTLEVLGACGAFIHRPEYGRLIIRGLGGAPRNRSGGPIECYMGESGTSCRLLSAVLAAGSGAFFVYGQKRLHERPVGDLVEALRRLGAEINYAGKPGCPPLMINAGGLSYDLLPEQSLAVSCDKSSQIMSGLLLAAPLVPPPARKSGRPGLTLMLGGSAPISLSYLGLSLHSLEAFGVPAIMEVMDGRHWNTADWRVGLDKLSPAPGRLRFRVGPAAYQARALSVEGDWSTASYFLAAGAVGPRPVRVEGLNPASFQGDRHFVDILRDMGARVEIDAPAVTVYPAPLRGLDLDMGNCPDLAPTLLAMAVHAKGATTVRNIAHLRLKESDRLAALGLELRKAGCSVTPLSDGLRLAPPRSGPRLPDPATMFNTHDDHRIAMALCLLGLPARSPRTGKQLPGFQVNLDNPACVEKSFPGFWQAWERVSCFQGKADRRE